MLGSTMVRYEDICDKQEAKIDERYCKKLERTVMSSAKEDLQGVDNQITYKWTYGNRTRTTQLWKWRLLQIRNRMIQIDATLGEELWIIDLLEIFEGFTGPCKQYWDKHDQKLGRAGGFGFGPSRDHPFYDAKMNVFMKSQIEGRDANARNAFTSKVDGPLATKRKDAIKNWDKIPDEDSNAALPDSRTKQFMS